MEKPLEEIRFIAVKGLIPVHPLGSQALSGVTNSVELPNDGTCLFMLFDSERSDNSPLSWQYQVICFQVDRMLGSDRCEMSVEGLHHGERMPSETKTDGSNGGDDDDDEYRVGCLWNE